MKLSFYGADHEVTGSCHYLEAAGKKIFIDCGLRQGENAKNQLELPIAANEIDYIILTHAHIDHTGRLPLLAKQGFCGKIYCTYATEDLCDIMLRDSAHIQEFEAEWRNRKGKRQGLPLVEPLYTVQDAETILKSFNPIPYEKSVAIDEGLEISFRDIGHLLGSASVTFKITENGITKTLLFSGDIGNINIPLIKDPVFSDKADIVVMESTYGDRLHTPPENYEQKLADIIEETFTRGGNVVIPSFAVGRTQEILYFIRIIKEKHLVSDNDFEVYVDSPLALNATNIYRENYSECYDEEALDLVSRGINPIRFPGLKTAVTSEESRNINFLPNKKVIISASGMCDAGRIKHHLKHNLWRSDSTILFVGYQAEGTTGRAILNGAKTVKILGEEIEVKAKIAELPGISGHADKKALIKFAENINPKPEQIFVVHGENSVCESFATELKEILKCPVTAPYYTESWDIATVTKERNGKVIESYKPSKFETEETVFYKELKRQGERLQSVIAKSKGYANKDIKKFTAELNSLIDRWS